MARKRKKKGDDATETSGNGHAQPTPGGNGFDGAKTKEFVERIENLHADIASIMGQALQECRQVHEDIKIVYQEAKDEAGIPKKALKRVIKARALEAKAAAVREDLEGEDQDHFDLIRQALGDLADTPLGQAATGRRTFQQANGDTIAKGDAVIRDFKPPRTADAPFAATDGADS